MFAVVGLGKTGLSVMRYLAQQKIPFFACDTREYPPKLAEIQKTFPDTPLFLGELPEEKLLAAEKIILSPGLPRSHLVLQKAIAKPIPVVGDIEPFVQHAKAPIIAITGTNAKGTVTTMLQSILEAAGLKVLVGGNFGVPVLDFLSQPVPDFYVLELSSFQLESTFSLQAAAATILNVTEDHLDYHHSMENYIAAKQRIYHNAKAVVFNFEDPFTWPSKNLPQEKFAFSLLAPAATHLFGLKNNMLMLGESELLSTNELPMKGTHNWLNALAASALAVAVNIPLDAIRAGLKNYRGLKHRCALVATHHGVQWFNDSKGTNVGATQAALAGLGPTLKGKIILIAGGQAKGQDFSPLKTLCEQYVKALILFGQDADQLEKTLAASTRCLRTRNLEEAIRDAKKLAHSGDAVLLSPACASLDMFKNYEDRGDQFEALLHHIIVTDTHG